MLLEIIINTNFFTAFQNIPTYIPRATLRNEWGGSIGVILRSHRRPTRSSTWAVFCAAAAGKGVKIWQQLAMVLRVSMSGVRRLVSNESHENVPMQLLLVIKFTDESMQAFSENGKGV